MNSDLGPSFTLGLSLLGSIKEYQQVVNFVPGSFDYEFVGFDENISKRRNDPHTMKKLQQKPAKKGKKIESGYKKRGSCSSASKAPAKRRRIVKAISRDNLPKIKQTNQEEIHVFVKSQILRFSIYEYSLITGLICFGNVDDFKYEDSSKICLLRRLMASLRQEFFVEKQLYRLGGIPQCSYFNIVPTAEELKKLDLPLTSFASDYPSTSSMPSSTGNPNQRSYQIDMKFNDLECMMNDKFSKVLMSLQSKNESVEKENIVKQSRQDGDPSDDVVHIAVPTSADSPVKETDKSVEMEDDKVNQAPSPFKKCEKQDKDDEIEKQSEIVVEEMEPIDKIFSIREPDMTLTIYKPPPTTPDEYMTSIVSAFPTPKKVVSEVKKTPAKQNRKPSKIYRSPFLTHFGSSSKENKKLNSTERKKYPFEVAYSNMYSILLHFEQHVDVIMYYLQKKYKNKNFSINKYTTIDCFFKVYIDKAYVNYYEADVGKELATQGSFENTDEVADMEMSLINTIKGLSPRAGQPWHLVNEVFVPIKYDGVFHWAVPNQSPMLTVSHENGHNFSLGDCGVFVAVCVEYLSEGLGISSLGIDAQYHRLRYNHLLCKYGSEKEENDYFIENDDPPRPRSKFTPKETDRVLHMQ
ncbi:hypothetical protein FXO38_18384 [Capsicum annuum]|nr:hypothetical protein FXO38_18384 [Capsicum annuum]